MQNKLRNALLNVKRYLPSFGFVCLVIVIILITLFYKWVFSEPVVVLDINQKNMIATLNKVNRKLSNAYKDKERENILKQLKSPYQEEYFKKYPVTFIHFDAQNVTKYRKTKILFYADKRKVKLLKFSLGEKLPDEAFPLKIKLNAFNSVKLTNNEDCYVYKLKIKKGLNLLKIVTPKELGDIKVKVKIIK